MRYLTDKLFFVGAFHFTAFVLSVFLFAIIGCCLFVTAKEEKKEESEESDDDMGFGLFD